MKKLFIYPFILLITLSFFSCKKEKDDDLLPMAGLALAASQQTGAGAGAGSGTGTETETTVAPSDLTYTGSPYTFTKGTAITTQTPTVTGTVTGCSSSPTLPTGLSIDSTTCAISGTATTAQSATDYTITASNDGGSTTATINITVMGTWVQDAYLKASNSHDQDQFSSAIAISGDYAIVATNREDSNSTSIDNTDGSASSDNSASGSGAAYVFKRDSSTGNWTQDAYLKASNAELGDTFGNRVAISGSNIIIGANLEDSNSTSIDNTDGSASTDNSASGSGAAYIFALK